MASAPAEGCLHTGNRLKLCLMPDPAGAAGPGGYYSFSAVLCFSQEKHSRLIMLEFLNIQKAVIL